MPNINEAVRLGAEMYFRSIGIKDQQERTRLLNQLTEQQIQNQQLERMQELEKISQQQQPISKFVVPEMQGVPFGEQFITPPEAPPGTVTQPTGRYGPNLDLPISQAPFIDLAMKLVNPPQPQMTPFQEQSLGLRQQELLSRQKEAEANRILREKEGEANRLSREAQAEENRKLREQMHNDNLLFRQSLLDLQNKVRNRLPPNVTKGISEKTAKLDQYAQLVDSFKDQFAGSYVGGPTATGIYSKLGMEKDRVNWWKQWLALDIQLRHDLFGATLTTGEQAAWDKVTVNENTNPSVVRQAMQTRIGIAKNALDREVEGYATAGWDVPPLPPTPQSGTINRKGWKITPLP